MTGLEPVKVEKSFQLASAPDALWPLLSNTAMLNRAMGVPVMTASAADPKDYSRQVSVSLLGAKVRWTEPPFDYVDSRGYDLVREFQNGPVTLFQAGLRLSPSAGGTTATLTGAIWPRWGWARPLAALFAAKAMGDMEKMYRRIDESLRKLGVFPAPTRVRTPLDEDLFAARAGELRATRADARCVERLLEHLREAADDEVRGMRPFELADRWALPRPAALGACLHATKAGLLDLKWEILCPNCSAPKETLSKLSELKPTSHCATCDIEYGVDFSNSVELRFSVHPSVRGAQAATFCAGGPANTRHASAQQRLDGSTVRAIDIDLQSRTHTVRFLQMKRTVLLRPAVDGPSTVSIDLAKSPDGTEQPFKPGPVRVLFQPTMQPALVRVEKEDWKSAAASAALVTTMQEFRDLFSSEVLAPGVEIGIKNLALLFTDLKGSTAMYERIGDATAYGIVRDHFDWLTGIVDARGGAVVKTIGDAVMAVFPAGAPALEAALDMQSRIGELNARLAPREPVALKIGVHQGPSIAINAGGHLDYFGTMVNVAARVQNESVGGDIVITKAVGSDAVCAAILSRRVASAEHFTIPLKGLSGQFDLWRLKARV